MLKLVGLIVALCSSSLFAQITTTAETRYRIDGIDGWQVVEDVVFAPKDSQPRLVAVGWVTVDTEASIVRIQAETQDRERLEVKQFTSEQFAILGTGKIWVDVTIVDFELEIFDQQTFTITVGESPAPPEPDEPDEPDEPETDVPEDEFDNLGQRIDAQADADNLQFDKRGRVAEAFATVAQAMEDRELLRSSDARDELAKLLKEIQKGPEWKASLEIADTDGKERPPLTWEQTIAWYRAVAAGFKGGEL